MGDGGGRRVGEGGEEKEPEIWGDWASFSPSFPIPTHLPTCIDGGARRLRFCSAFHQKVTSLIKQQRESPGWKRRRETEPCCWRKGASQSWCWSEGSAATGLVLCVCLLVSSAAAAALFILIVLLLGCFFLPFFSFFCDSSAFPFFFCGMA